MNLYNEIDPYCAGWLRNLSACDLIPHGTIDTRSIKELVPDDLSGYTQCHFFAGIAGWSKALELAGWPTDLPVWTGSCPCQPFSVAGKRKGTADDRHLWPDMYNLILIYRPPVIFGEQVASKDGKIWLDGVRVGLEALGYQFWAADLCAAGVGAPHIRQRLYWVGWLAVTNDTERWADVARRDERNWGKTKWEQGDGKFGECGENVRMADHQWAGLEVRTVEPIREERATIERDRDVSRLAEPAGRESSNRNLQRSGEQRQFEENGGVTGRLAVTGLERSGRVLRGSRQSVGQVIERTSDQSGRSSADGSFWSDYSTVYCRDGFTRRIEPGTFPLAHGVSNRMGKLRAYGNAIVPELAAEFISTWKDVVMDGHRSAGVVG